MRDITCCLSCKKNTRNINPKVVKTKNNRKMMLSRCSIWLLNNKITCKAIVLLALIKYEQHN